MERFYFLDPNNFAIPNPIVVLKQILYRLLVEKLNFWLDLGEICIWYLGHRIKCAYLIQNTHCSPRTGFGPIFWILNSKQCPTSFCRTIKFQLRLLEKYFESLSVFVLVYSFTIKYMHVVKINCILTMCIVKNTIFEKTYSVNDIWGTLTVARSISEVSWL